MIYKTIFNEKVKWFAVSSSFTILFLLLAAGLFSNQLFAQCTDADADGYYYEAGCGTPRDCNDASAGINPGATETCNGFDDDCDGSLDEGCDTSCDNPERMISDEKHEG